MRRTHMTGLLLWRGGLLLAGAFALVEAARYLLAFVDVAPAVRLGLGCLIAGAVLVLLSFVMERVIDARREGDLTE